MSKSKTYIAMSYESLHDMIAEGSGTADLGREAVHELTQPLVQVVGVEGVKELVARPLVCVDRNDVRTA